MRSDLIKNGMGVEAAMRNEAMLKAIRFLKSHCNIFIHSSTFISLLREFGGQCLEVQSHHCETRRFASFSTMIQQEAPPQPPDADISC